MTRGNTNQARPYRSHASPACTACRRRKSRCTAEAGASACLMCQAHGTQCSFLGESGGSGESGPAPKRQKTASRQTERRLPGAGRASTSTPSRGGLESGSTGAIALGSTAVVAHEARPPSPHDTQGLPISLHPADDDDSPHILGPAVTGDSHVLADYLSNARMGSRAIHMIRPMLSGGDTEPVMFTKVQKRPLGMAVDPTPPSLQLHMIQKLVEPWEEPLVEAYVHHVKRSKVQTNLVVVSFPLSTRASRFLTMLLSGASFWQRGNASLLLS